MNIFGQEITDEMFPSYVSPADTPTHLYQDMQETLARSLQTQPVPMKGGASMEQTGNQWSNNGQE